MAFKKSFHQENFKDLNFKNFPKKRYNNNKSQPQHDASNRLYVQCYLSNIWPPKKIGLWICTMHDSASWKMSNTVGLKPAMNTSQLKICLFNTYLIHFI